MPDDDKDANLSQEHLRKLMEMLRFKRRAGFAGADNYQVDQDAIDFLTEIRGHLVVVDGTGKAFIE